MGFRCARSDRADRVDDEKDDGLVREDFYLFQKERERGGASKGNFRVTFQQTHKLDLVKTKLPKFFEIIYISLFLIRGIAYR